MVTMCIYLPSKYYILNGIFLAKHIILNVSSSVDAVHMPNEYNLVIFDISLIVAWLTVPA